MNKLFYKPKDAWVGDIIPFYENGKYYIFYLHDPRIKKNQYAEETTWHMVSTTDFIHFYDHGQSIRRGTDKEPNKNIYTGSVLKIKDNKYYAFYTAYNEDIKVDGRSVQSVMIATSSDLVNWKNNDEFILYADDEIYEPFDWRDPFVFWNEKDECYWMLLTARLKNSGEHRGGSIALCKSKNLINWSYEQPFYAPQMYITMECPEIFKMGEWWYLIYSTFSDRFATHYRISKSLEGPWIIPTDDVFDSRANYAIKTASDGRRRYAFGWIASKTGNNDFGAWEWGGTMVIHELVQCPLTGELRVKPIEGMQNYYGTKKQLKRITQYNGRVYHKDGGVTITSQTLGAALFEIPKDCFELYMEVSVDEAAEFGIALHTDANMENGYFLKIDIDKGQMAWDMWPRSGKGLYQWQIKGDIAYQIETLRKIQRKNNYNIRIIREEDICVVYIDDETALSTRMYNHKGGFAGLYVVQGSANMSRYHVKTNT